MTRLERLAWLAIAAAAATISLKTFAWLLTGSVGLLADAAESVVNLAAAIVALLVIRLSQRPADVEHAYGHGKADYFSAGLEGGLVLIAAGVIAVAAIGRLAEPAEIDHLVFGLAASGLASLVNLAVARHLIAVGRRERSIVLEADGRHLMADVWTSLGVIVGVVLASVTGWEQLDPLVALAVAANILRIGGSLVRRSVGGLMDVALPEAELQDIEAVLRQYEARNVQFHALRTRSSGRRTFISVHVLVPGDWTVKRGHDLVEELERDLVAGREPATVFTHLEPREDPSSFADKALDRQGP